MADVPAALPDQVPVFAVVAVPLLVLFAAFVVLPLVAAVFLAMFAVPALLAAFIALQLKAIAGGRGFLIAWGTLAFAAGL